MKLCSALVAALLATGCSTPVAAVPAFAPDTGLRDAAIASAASSPPFYLDGDAWTITPPSSIAGGAPFPAVVPGDLITDMEAAGLIADPLHETNFLSPSPPWDAGVFTYSRAFSLSDELMRVLGGGGRLLLVCDGIKMVADLSVNGVRVGTVNNQFTRGVWDVTAALKSQDAAVPAVNELTIAFAPFSDPRQTVERRWAAFSGGWDWAPYTLTNAGSNKNAFTFTKGIWKSVYLVGVPAATLTLDSLVPAVTYKGTYPTAPLVGDNGDGSNAHGGFAVGVTVHASNWGSASNGGAVTASVEVRGEWDGGVVALGSLTVPPNASASVQVWLPASPAVALWWPNGLGPQTLYGFSARLTNFSSSALAAASSAAAASASASSTLGFRVLTLVTANDSDPSTLEGINGSGNFTMRLRVNGANIYARGGNAIPPDELEGRYSSAALRRTVASAAAAGFNTVRVWGGGIYFPSVFYDALDAAGILAYHDAMYDVQNEHQPAVTPGQTSELQHAARRLARHPSLAIWDACNECGGSGLYASFVATTLATEDPSRPIWPACPSGGWASGVDRLWSLPNGAPLIPQPATMAGSTIEVHGPYRHGGGWPAINGMNNDGPFDPNLPPALAGPVAAGPAAPGVFASEFGSSVFPSFESFATSLDPAHWGVHGGAPPDTCTGQWVKACNGSNALAQRNYPADSIIATYFGNSVDLDAVGAAPFARQLYLSGLGSALVMKADIEARRGGNEQGTVIWQLGEVWPTGGWGTLEYGFVGLPSRQTVGAGSAPGQVQGGRWKTLHHWLAETLFQDVLIVCGAGSSGNNTEAPALCYVRNDDPLAGFAAGATASLAALHLPSGQLLPLGRPVALPALPPGAAALVWFCAANGAIVTTPAAAASCGTWAALLPAASGGACAGDGSDCLLSLAVSYTRAPTVPANKGKKEEAARVASNWGLLAPPAALQAALPPSSVNVTAASSSSSALPGQVALTVASNATALFVTLTTPAQGRFSRNGFWVTPSAPVELAFVCFEGVEGTVPGAAIPCSPEGLLPTIRVAWL